MTNTEKPFYPVPMNASEIPAYVARHATAAVLGVSAVEGSPRLVDVAVRSESGATVQVRTNVRTARAIGATA